MPGVFFSACTENDQTIDQANVFFNKPALFEARLIIIDYFRDHRLNSVRNSLGRDLIIAIE